MSASNYIVTPYVSDAELESFLAAWNVQRSQIPSWLLLQRDTDGEGCAVTKNRGVRRAMVLNADVVLVLDGDCYPSEEAPTLEGLLAQHVAALEPQPVALFQKVTDPASRGTPYGNCSLTLPIAASMGFWHEVPDYCAVRQLAFGALNPMAFLRETVMHRYFALCGMNLAFRPKQWWPWCQFIDVSRFDDIWMGWLWQREAYQRGYCFNLNGPTIRHARQSNVWKNLRDEAVHLEASETLWQQIATQADGSYVGLLRLLPADVQGRMACARW